MGENMNISETNHSNLILKFLLASGLIYAALGLFGGLPVGANISAFVIGLIILFLAIVALMGFVWYAVIKPLPANLAPSETKPLSDNLRQGVAIFLTLMSGMGLAGGLWDITWHVRSGLRFGEDFFWEPHQFIYVALIMPIIVAGFIWFMIAQKGSGSLRQRFKADIPITLIMIGGTAMLFILPVDPLWHFIYGEDLTGLSLPHFVFSVSSTLTTMGAMSILLSYMPLRQTWQTIFNIRGLEILVISTLSLNIIGLLMPTLLDWEAISLPAKALPRLPALVAARPDWAMPFLAAFVAIYSSSMALHITKRFGTATLIWLIASVTRSLLFLAFGYNDTGMSTMFMLLPFTVAIDIVTWYRVSRNQSVSSLLVAVVSTVFGIIAVLPQIQVSYIDPILGVDNIPSIILAMFVGSFLAAWMGKVLGNIVYNTPRFEVPEKQPVVAKSIAFAMYGLAFATIGIAVFFVLTTTIPAAAL